jgi:uncharacterized membrane protein YidH (DUF202 family)
MRGSVIFLGVSIGSGIPYLLAISDSQTFEPHGIAMFPNALFAVGLALVLFVTGPTSALALIQGINERKDYPSASASIVVLISSVIFVLVVLVLLKLNGVLR